MAGPRIQYINNGTEVNVDFPLHPDFSPVETSSSIDHEFVSDTGVRQVVHYANEVIIKYIFTMMPLEFINGPLKKFHVEHAFFGRTFKYFPDSSSTDSEEYELNKRTYSPKKNKSTIDLYNIELEFRRVTNAP